MKENATLKDIYDAGYRNVGKDRSISDGKIKETSTVKEVVEIVRNDIKKVLEMRTDKEPKAPAEMKEKVFLIEYQDRNLNTNSFYADNFEIGPAIEDVIEELKEDEAFEIKITPRYLTAKQIEEIKQASE